LICSLLTAGTANSTTVVPPTFDALVAGANTVFVGEVMAVRARWATSRQGRAIFTDVTFRVEDVWKGAVGTVTMLEFMGGTIDGTTMDVVGMPRFTVGQRAVLFVSGERAISPLVGFWHGRMRVERDPFGVDRVRMNDGASLGSTAQIGPQRVNPMLSITPMRLSELKSQVTARAQALARRSPGEVGRGR
jgi:hypothetical protein